MSGEHDGEHDGESTHSFKIMGTCEGWERFFFERKLDLLGINYKIELAVCGCGSPDCALIGMYEVTARVATFDEVLALGTVLRSIIEQAQVSLN